MRSRNRDGYGRVGGDRDQPGPAVELAHRVAFRLTHGYCPPRLRHRCDNPPCCNVRHLLPGTQLQNIHDAVERGRLRPARGEAHPRARLTEALVREVVARRRAGATYVAIADGLGLTCSQVADVVTGRTWTHITGGRI